MAKVEKAVVFKSNEVIDYSEGGVVSKELVHSNAGNLIQFRCWSGTFRTYGTIRCFYSSCRRKDGTDS